MRYWCVVLAGTLLCRPLASGSGIRFGERTAAADPDPHAYFTSLIARGDLFRAYSLRPIPGAPVASPYYENQLLRRALGGYAVSNNTDLGTWINYLYPRDAHPDAQDAAKVVIPPFKPQGADSVARLAVPIGPSTDPIALPAGSSSSYGAAGGSVMIDSEIMDVHDPDGPGPLRAFDKTTGRLYVRRGGHGTPAVSHGAGAPVRQSTNTVPNAVRLPLGTSDGHTYFFTWDGYWTSSYLKTGLTNHKAFNFLSKGIWLEPDTHFAGGAGDAKIAGFNVETDVASFQVRSYNDLGGPAHWTVGTQEYAGPAVTRTSPLQPQLATFTIRPDRWIRFFVRIEQRANDYDCVDTWVADHSTGPVQIHRRLPVSVRDGTITDFLLEYNTSNDRFGRGDLRDLVAYVRNFVALRDAPDSDRLLQRPLARP
jgi:hypothetical protein